MLKLEQTCTIMEYLVVGLTCLAFVIIPAVILSCLGAVLYGVYYFVNCPAVQTWLGY